MASRRQTKSVSRPQKVVEVAPARTKKNRHLTAAEREAKEAVAYQQGQAKRSAQDKRAYVFKRVAEIQQVIDTFDYIRIIPTSHTSVYVPPDPVVSCPKCSYGLSHDEVFAGFTEDTLDYYTQCPKCSHRFACTRIVNSENIYQRFVWLCPAQTKEAYDEWSGRVEDSSLDALFKDAPHIAWSAYVYGDRTREDLSVTEVVAKYLE